MFSRSDIPDHPKVHFGGITENFGIHPARFLFPVIENRLRLNFLILILIMYPRIIRFFRMEPLQDTVFFRMKYGIASMSIL